MEKSTVHSGLNGLIITLQLEKATILAIISLWRVKVAMSVVLTEYLSPQAGALKVNGSSLILLSLTRLWRLQVIECIYYYSILTFFERFLF
jgi:hypothetical protein